MVVTLWFIWSERNCIREEGRRRPAEAIVRSIELYANENLLQHTSKPTQVGQRKQVWRRPPNGVLKLNCDGSFLPSEKSGSWGCLIRDSDGDVVQAGRGKINNLLSAFQAELIACLQGIQMAASLGIGRLILATDAMEVVGAVNSEVHDASAVGHLMEEIKSLLSLNFISFECVFGSRSCNEAAHVLAKLGHMCTEGEIISDSIPECISVIVANDLLANE